MKLLASVVALRLLAASSGAAPPSPHTVYSPAVAVQWKDRLHEADVQLRAGDWKKGTAMADSTLREMRDRIASGDASGSLLAVALLLRAIGEAGLGDSESAAWDFGAAQALYPDYSRVDLKPFGDVAAMMDPWRYKGGAPSLQHGPIPEGSAPSTEVTPPRKIAGKQPEYPYAKARACIQSPIVVHTVIAEDGKARFPAIDAGADPILALAAFDALRTWRFDAAKRGGKPVQVFFDLTINFKVRHCY
ncbi:MAG TPA: energy transducer TonB [Thermoanaerobaculia bacterium]|nr:energy transducer TonB [Thermoanaerobaculia bacterium]